MSAPKSVYASRDFIILNLGMVDLVGFDAAVLFQRIAYRCDDRAGGWVPWEATHAQLSAETRLSEHRVRNALGILRDMEWISSERADKFRPTLSWLPLWDDAEAVSVTEDSSVTWQPDAQHPVTEDFPVTSSLSDVGDQLPPAEAGEGVLFAVPEPEPEPDTGPPKTAQTLVARWCDGYRAASGADAPRPIMRRVAGQAGSLARACESQEDWVAAWNAAYTAGGRGQVDMTAAMVQVRSQFQKRNHDVDALMAMTNGAPVADPTVALTLSLMGRAK